jgi:hypothetical protein
VAQLLQAELQQQGQTTKVGCGRQAGLQLLHSTMAAAQLQQQATSAGTA